MDYYIITGGSKGLGLALAKKLSTNHKVTVLARNTIDVEGIESHSLDLSKTDQIEKTLENIFEGLDSKNYQAIHLINNAGVVGPVSETKKLSNDEVSKSINLNLTAPIVLTAAFLEKTSSMNLKRTIINVSSGVATNPIVGWGVYSASKAALENFSTGLAKEFVNDPNTEIASFNPGIIDTDMQGQIRESQASDFPDVQRFKEFKEEGALQTPEEVADNLIGLVRKMI